MTNSVTDQPPDLHDGARVGIGYDIHRLVPGCQLVLGGVNIPYERGFDTHSDGDVLSHALIDAMAGAIADGDLGTHFPEDDPDADDARSLDFVVEFGQTVRARGYRVTSVDSFVVLGTVRLRPHLDAMRDNIAGALGLADRPGLGQGPIERRPRPGGHRRGGQRDGRRAAQRARTATTRCRRRRRAISWPDSPLGGRPGLA